MTTVYVTHYTPLVERKCFMQEQCARHNVEPVYIENFDREVLGDELNNFTKIKPSEISLFLKHFEAYKRILDSGKHYGIVMEDDCIFNDSFNDELSSITSHLPNDFDIVYCGVFQFLNYFQQTHNRHHPVPDTVGETCGLYNMKGVEVFPWIGNNKGTDFYIISKTGCEKLLQYKARNIKINEPIDHYLKVMLHENVYWTKHEFTKHGSWKGHGEVFSSSLR